MNKVWLGYLSSLLFLLAGILMIFGGKWIGALFIILAVAGVVLRMYMNKKKD